MITHLKKPLLPLFFQIVKNFENAIVKTGGKKVYYNKDEGVATLHTQSAGKDIWVVLTDFRRGKRGNFELIILEIEGGSRALLPAKC